MKNVLVQAVTKLKQNIKLKKRWRRVVSGLGAAVVFCTTYALILPAITMEGELICEITEHFHSEECYEQTPVAAMECGLPEDAAVLHSHDGNCYDNDVLICTLKERTAHSHSEECSGPQGDPICEITEENHAHTDECYAEVKECDRKERELHEHTDSCYDGEALICEKPLVIAHQHSENCFAEEPQMQETLVCTAEEHIHSETCYEAAEAPEESGYLCGMGAHTHDENCTNESAECSIPEHKHEAACIVEGVDTTADVEVREQWESSLDGVKRSGDWGKDLVKVATTQLGYTESTKNIILTESEEFKGYTRYGEKYGKPYGDWSSMFLDFCLEYAGIKDFRAGTNLAQWQKSLEQQGLLITDNAAIPEIGDIVLITLDGGSKADCIGIVAEASENGSLHAIVGDPVGGKVESRNLKLGGADIIGWCALPENPAAETAIEAAKKVNAAIEALPAVSEAEKELLALNEKMDKDGYDALLNEITTAAEKAIEAYEALDAEQKAMIGDIEKMFDLKALCASAEWQQLPEMETDDGFLTVLNAVYSETETVKNLETAQFGFELETESYSKEPYGEARIKFEIVLPQSEDKAVFDLDAMAWLEDTKLTSKVGEDGTTKQILTGWVKLTSPDMNVSVVPGRFTESIAVEVLSMEHNEVLGLQISAALEHNTWEGLCETHQAEEKLSISSQHLTVNNDASPEEMLKTYEELLSAYTALSESGLEGEELSEAAEELWSIISEKYLTGHLTEEAFLDLDTKVSTMRYGDLNSIAESGNGVGWKKLIDSGWFTEYDNSVSYAQPKLFAMMRSAAPPAAYAAVTNPSDVQIRDEGGANTSREGAVYVSKTIEGTDTENVFDITLDIVTQDIVTEVYKEPDMAVVIVMDISNTMVENDLSPGVSRYEAAMRAAENFIDNFQKNNLGASNIGFVAFNSHAHQVFGMSQCYTAAQATALKKAARTNTGNKGPNNPTAYAASHDRFTNIEAGLKRGYDLLNTVSNKNKYIVFLSDGFPTTYIQSGYTGYDTYDTSGSRFYDSVEKYNGKNRPCSYGVSYSNEAAIRARKMATTIKNGGATIFSVGVDIGGQTIKSYVDSFKGRSFTVVDRRNTNYEIGSASDPAAFKTWLGNKIGSGYSKYYYDSTNTTGLLNAFNSIFAEIKELNAASSHLDWVASDPMPDMGMHEIDGMEFIGFFDRDGNLVDGDLSGTSADGWENENTATFDTAKNTILWDIKKSGYVSTAVGNRTNYECTLTYRVRLKNENTGFEEYTAYDTNDVTTLTYRIIDKTGDKVTVSEQRTVDFPIPAVEGYLAELEFKKVDSLGDPLAEATFELRHDTDNCGHCRGDGKGFVPLDPMEATSGEDGIVKFTNIPSGHSYTLKETVVPDGYKPNSYGYQVKVSYDALTVTVEDAVGNEVPWNEFIENHTEYTLPSTGGNGHTALYTFGLLMIVTAAIMYGYSRKRRSRKEAKK